MYKYTILKSEFNNYDLDDVRVKVEQTYDKNTVNPGEIRESTGLYYMYTFEEHTPEFFISKLMVYFDKIANDYANLSSRAHNLLVAEQMDHYRKNEDNEASQIYAQIGMTCGGKPKADKARIGRAFAKRIGQPGRFENIEQVFLPNGKPKRSVGNRAAMYRIKNTDQVLEMSDEEIDVTLADMFPNAKTAEELEYEMECLDNA